MVDLAVIMSVYKNDKLNFVKKSVHSILDQTFTQFHYFIIFDGSVDSEIDKFINSLSDNRIKLFRLDKNEGLAFALNFLLKIILNNPDYKLIARMDADDISLPFRFEKQRDFLLNNLDISCVGCWYEEIDENDKHLSDCKLPVEHKVLKKLYYTRTPFVHPSVIYRRTMVEEAGFYPTNTVLMEDNFLWGQALKAGARFANIPEYLFRFRKDRNFYKRRSGIKYGWNYILTRFSINKSLDFPLYTYVLTFIIGVIKMMPSSIVRYFYLVKERHKCLSLCC
jgi:glycosyltransferase involved in cell wall biosynthesis